MHIIYWRSECLLCGRAPSKCLRDILCPVPFFVDYAKKFDRLLRNRWLIMNFGSLLFERLAWFGCFFHLSLFPFLELLGVLFRFSFKLDGAKELWFSLGNQSLIGLLRNFIFSFVCCNQLLAIHATISVINHFLKLWWKLFENLIMFVLTFIQFSCLNHERSIREWCLQHQLFWIFLIR